MGIVLTSLLPWSASSGTGLRPGPPHFSTDQDVSSDEIVGDGYVILEAISIFSIRLSFSFASPYFLLMHSGVMTSLTMISNNFLSAIVSRYVLQLRGIWRQLTLVYPALCESFFLTLSLLLSRPSRFFFFSQIYSEGCFVNFFFVSVFFFLVAIVGCTKSFDVFFRIVMYTSLTCLYQRRIWRYVNGDCPHALKYASFKRSTEGRVLRRKVYFCPRPERATLPAANTAPVGRPSTR